MTANNRNPPDMVTGKFTATIDGEQFEVTVGYIAGEDVTIYEVMDGRVDITNMLTDDEYADLAKTIQKHLTDSAKAARESVFEDKYHYLHGDV